MTARWGVQVHGSEGALDFWLSELKPPFDPHLQTIEDERGDFVVLRSPVFSQSVSGEAVNHQATEIFSLLSVAMPQDFSSYPLQIGAVVEFIADQLPRRTHFLEAESIKVQARVGRARLAVVDAAGRPVARDVAFHEKINPAKIQRWSKAASLDQRVASAIIHLRGNPGWFEFYKACEALKKIRVAGVSDSKIDLLKWTANMYRHHTTPHVPKVPMTLSEARAFIDQWLEAAVEHVLANGDVK